MNVVPHDTDLKEIEIWNVDVSETLRSVAEMLHDFNYMPAIFFVYEIQMITKLFQQIFLHLHGTRRRVALVENSLNNTLRKVLLISSPKEICVPEILEKSTTDFDAALADDVEVIWLATEKN